jgi:aminoglycoside/choline kinase family phosphotransferase
VTLQKPKVAAPPSNLSELVGKCLGEPAPELVRQPGGISPRQFFRMRRASGELAMVMWLPDEAPERELSRRLARPLPFLELRELLEKRRVRVPRLFGALPDEGLLVVEDLGETLAERCAREPTATAALYRRAVSELVAAQRALAELPEGSIVSTRRFDGALLEWELSHFREWGVEALGVVLSLEELATFERATSFLVESMRGFPQGFTHRDYQSRNLLVLPDDSIAWIDFQDALLGPRAYDLVALLRDSYQSFDDAFVEARLDDYALASGASAAERSALGFELDVITVQRKLKDAGRFVFFERTRGDASYLRYFVPTLEMVRGALSRLAGRAELRGLSEIVTRQIEIGRSRGMLPP